MEASYLTPKDFDADKAKEFSKILLLTFCGLQESGDNSVAADFISVRNSPLKLNKYPITTL